jgi:hypothetical protein
LAGQITCPRSPPDALAAFTDVLAPKEEWVIKGICAYVPQVRYLSLADVFVYLRRAGQAAWLRNASIKGVHHSIPGFAVSLTLALSRQHSFQLALG